MTAEQQTCGERQDDRGDLRSTTSCTWIATECTTNGKCQQNADSVIATLVADERHHHNA